MTCAKNFDSAHIGAYLGQGDRIELAEVHFRAAVVAAPSASAPAVIWNQDPEPSPAQVIGSRRQAGDRSRLILFSTFSTLHRALAAFHTRDIR